MNFTEQIIQKKGLYKEFSCIFIAISPQFSDRTLKSLKEILPFI